MIAAEMAAPAGPAYPRPVRVCIVGAGAIGGLLATRLAVAGEEVSVFARGETLAAIRDTGLTLVEPDGSVVAAPAVERRTTSPPSARRTSSCWR